MPPTPTGIQFENSIRELLSKIGFCNVPAWGDNRVTLELGGQEIDAFGRIGNLYFVIDAKTSNSSGHRGGAQNEIDTITGYMERVRNAIRAQYENEYGYEDCIFIYWTKGKTIADRHKTQARAAGIALRDDYDLDCYFKAYEILENQDLVRNGFLKDISLQLGRDIFIQGTPVTPKAIRTTIRNKCLYTIQLDVSNMLRFSYVFRLETNNILQSYQRLLNKKKIEKIRTYLRNGGYFANNILVATDEVLNFTTETPRDNAAIGTLSLPNKPCYLEVIDGQHRLLAFSNLRNFQNVCLSVTIIQGLSKIQRAELFTIVNKEQTRVSAHLLWDLYSLIKPNSTEGKISLFVQKLNKNSPFKDLIKLPRERSSSAFLSLTNMCSSMFKRSGLYANYGDNANFFNVVKAFFEVIQSDTVLGEDWNRSKQNNGKKGYICTNNSIAIQFYLLSKILRYRDANNIAFPTGPTIATEWKPFLRETVVAAFREFMNQNLNDQDDADPYGTLRKETSNEGSRKDVTDRIFQLIEF